MMIMSQKFRLLREGQTISREEDYVEGVPWGQSPPVLPRFTFCLEAQVLARGMAWFDIIKNTLGILVFGYVVVAMLCDDSWLPNLDTGDKDGELKHHVGGQFTVLTWASFLVFACVIALIFSIILLQGASQMHYQKLRVWFGFQLIAVLMFAGVHIWIFARGSLQGDSEDGKEGSLLAAKIFAVFFLNYFWVAYHMYVIYLVMKDIWSGRILGIGIGGNGLQA